MLKSNETWGSVVDLRVYRDPSHTPVIILVDLQQEYLSMHRALKLNEINNALKNCRSLLQVARDNGFPIAFVRWSQKSKFFNSSQGYSGWINGFTPHGSDMIFERSMPSCYTSEWFTDMMENGGGMNAVLAGFTGSIACLSTILDAYNRGHTITFLADASASHAINSHSEARTHEFVSKIISLYSPATTTENWIAEQARTRKRVIGGQL